MISIRAYLKGCETQQEKLDKLRTIPDGWISYLEISKSRIPYLTHWIAEDLLQEVFQDVSWEIIDKIKTRDETREVKKKDGKGQEYTKKTRYIEYGIQVRYTINGDTRDMISGHKGYENPATTEYDILKGALSKAHTGVLRSFGVARNLVQKENKAYSEVEQDDVEIKIAIEGLEKQIEDGTIAGEDAKIKIVNAMKVSRSENDSKILKDLLRKLNA